MIPQPKYAIGDTVFTADTHTHATRLPCPDCKDSKTWTVTTPAGESFDVECQRCAGTVRDVPTLYDRVFTPVVTRLTIGQVRVEYPRGPHAHGDPVQYMCVETGVWSGQIYNESKLYGDENEAMAAAHFQVLEQRAAWLAKPEPAANRAISRLSLRAALGATAASTVWQCTYHFGQLKEKLEETVHEGVHVGRSELESLLNIEMPWHLEPAQNPVVALVVAARGAGSVALEVALKPFEFLATETKAAEDDL